MCDNILRSWRLVKFSFAKNLEIFLAHGGQCDMAILVLLLQDSIEK